IPAHVGVAAVAGAGVAITSVRLILLVAALDGRSPCVVAPATGWFAAVPIPRQPAVDTTVGDRRRPLSVADRAAVAARAATAARATAPTRAMSARAGTGAVQPVRFAPSPFLGVGAAVIAGRRQVRAVLVAAAPRAARRATGIVAAGAARRATGIAPTGAARRATGVAPTAAARRATGVAHAAAAGLRPSTPRLNAAASAAVASGAGR